MKKTRYSSEDIDAILRRERAGVKVARGVLHHAGRVDIAKPGCLLGTFTDKDNGRKIERRILSAGPVAVGGDTIVLGVAIGGAGFFACRGGRLALWPGTTRRGQWEPVPDPTPFAEDESAMAAWANGVAERFLDYAHSGRDREMLRDMEAGYRELVRALVERTLVDLAESHPSLQATQDHIIRGICPSWTHNDLFNARASIRHALLVCLACAASAETAGVLIARAAHLELRLPLIDEGSATRMYTQAATILAKGAPAWWQLGAATAWRASGKSISGVLGEAFWRTVNDAQARDRTWAQAMGYETNAMRMG